MPTTAASPLSVPPPILERMLTMLLYVLIVGLVAALLFLVASAVFGRAEELGPLPEGTTETVLPAHDISAADVRDLRFQQVFRGYKAGEVDWALARLAARIDELEIQLAQATGEPPQTRTADPVEQTGPGAAPGDWTGPQPGAAPAATPNAPAESRIERPGNTPESGTIDHAAPQQGDTPGHTNGMHSSLAGIAVGYGPAPQSDTPGIPTGQIPWPGPAQPPALGAEPAPAPVGSPQTGPFTAPPPPEVSVAFPQPTSAYTPTPNVSTASPQPSGPFTPDVSAGSSRMAGPKSATPEISPVSPQPTGPFTAAPGVSAGSAPPSGPFMPPPELAPGSPQPSGPSTPVANPSTGSREPGGLFSASLAPGPDGYPGAPHTYPAGPPAPDQPAGFAPPQTGGLALPPQSVPGQPSHGQPGAPVVWPGQPGHNAPGQQL